MSFLRPVVRDAQEITRNVEAWESLLGGASNAGERFSDSLAKASLTTPPPGPAPWWAPAGGASGPVLVNPQGRPVGTGSSGSAGSGGSGGHGIQRAPTGLANDPSRPWSFFRTDEDPGFDVFVYGPPGSHPGWVWDWLAAMWVHDPGAVSGRSAGGGGGGAAPTYIRTDSLGNYNTARYNQSANPQLIAPLAPTPGRGKSFEVTQGEAAIVNEVRSLRTDLVRALARDDNGAQLRRRGEL